MIEFRDKIIKKHGLDLLVYKNPRGDLENITPFTKGSKIYTDIMKTEALKQALDKYKFDIAFGGARRDEEKSRAKERIFSFRNKFHNWDPKKQRVELFKLFNPLISEEETIRCFPISNWTELDVWEYIKQENIDIVPLYFSKKRSFVKRQNTNIMIDDDRFALKESEKIINDNIRFRTLGCYPLTGAISSNATNVADIITEIKNSDFLKDKAG